MNRLHKSYGSWAWIRRFVQDGVCRLSFDRVRTAGWHLLVVAVLCLLLWHYWGTTETILARQRLLPSSGVLAVCCGWIAIYLGIIVFIMIRESQRGDHLRYEPASDRLVLPRLGVELPNARQHVTFSHERYSGMDNDVIELNVVIDGERRPFLQSASPRGQIERVTRWLAELGLTVTRHDATKGSS